MSALTTRTRTRITSSVNQSTNNNTNNTMHNYDNNYDNELVRRQSRRLVQQLGVATGVSLPVVIYLLIPTALLLAILLFGTIFTTFAQSLVAYLQQEIQFIIRGRGISGSFTTLIPQSLLDILTQSSVHDILSDPDGIIHGANEHIPYLLLYLIPGLTPEQLDTYLARLSPRHQHLLRNEEGLLGYFFNRNSRYNEDTDTGNNNNTNNIILRLLIGDEGLREQQQEQHQQHRITTGMEVPPTILEQGTLVTQPSGLDEPY